MELERYFTEYILIVFYNEFEDKLKIIFKNFLKEHSTKELAGFISEKMDTIFKRIDKKDIEKTIKSFGEKKKIRFQEIFRTEDKELILQKYKNLIANRHLVAHSSKNISISWQEVEDIDKIGEQILSGIKESLKVS